MSKKGFTLIEMLLTTIVISIGLFGTMVLFENASRGVVDSDMDVMSAGLAREKLEEIITNKSYYGYDSISEGTTSDEPTLGLGPGPIYTFERVVMINDVLNDLQTDDGNDLIDTGYKRIDVSVSWGVQVPKKTITVSTIVTKYGF